MAEALCEEVVRGGPAAALSDISERLLRTMRTRAEMPPWIVVASGGAGPCYGRVVRVGDMLDALQLEVEHGGTNRGLILMADKVGGGDDIPPGVVAIVTRDDVDILSHVAIRAREEGVVLLVCADPAEYLEVGNIAG